MKLRNVSASQVTTYNDCPRAWHFSWVKGLKTPPSLAMQRGSHVHKAAESTLLTGVVPDSEWGRYAQAMVPHLPMGRNQDFVVEKEIWIDTAPGLPKWLGYIDLLDNSRMFSEFLRVTDHKTTSDFRYAKTPEELKENIQLMSYAQWVFASGFDEEFLEVGHLYIKTAKKTPKNPRVKPVYVEVDACHVEMQWESYLPIIENMVRDADVGNSDLVEPLGTSTGLCKKYGGCPHRARCGIHTPVNLFGNVKGKGKGKEMSSFLEKLKNKKASSSTKEKGAEGVLPPDAPSRTNDDATEPEETEEVTEPVEKPKKKRSSSKKKKSGLTLYIDCTPVKGETDATLFDDWFNGIVIKLNDAVSENKSLPDYRLLPFAEEKAALSDAVHAALKNGMPNTMVVMSSAPGAKDVLPVLIPHATQVIRALRG